MNILLLLSQAVETLCTISDEMVISSFNIPSNLNQHISWSTAYIAISINI